MQRLLRATAQERLTPCLEALPKMLVSYEQMREGKLNARGADNCSPSTF